MQATYEHGLEQLSLYMPKIEALARRDGLDFDPVDFELVPNTFMMEVAVYGLPIRMPHWSFGVRYIHQQVQHRMGGSHIFEVVFPGNPNRAYLVTDNGLAQNTLVTAHVLGHADFSKNNALFARMQQQVGYHIVTEAAERAHSIQAAIEEYGQRRVEMVLDAALALEQHIDVDQPIHRHDYPVDIEPRANPKPTGFRSRYAALPGEEAPAARGRQRAPVPPHPESDLLWFMARYAPDMEGWERDIFLAVREESFYFYPVFACQIMNEGWASYWHARLLREADFLPDDVYLDAIKSHSDVIRPYASGKDFALALNPYHVGFAMWEHIIENEGLDTALRIRAEEDDFSFIRNHLDEALVEKLQLLGYRSGREPGAGIRVQVEDMDIDALREQLIAPKFNFSAPHVQAVELSNDGSLMLRHDHAADGRGLDLDRAKKVLDYIALVWRRPVALETIDGEGNKKTLAAR
ncbi:SpoVR family protein [Candidimonas nitroreducens]|uniref:Stage V sporulation protein R n=1 Tax=Candidimonas nitroreducens TaxID=683354 RepID=A0A225M7H2_9BURK|nr:SpoVR family protein [Candidimonas nitroreducens]OWT56183.1 stage V sporulation protein R [Candidimonas nitroreducens]